MLISRTEHTYFTQPIYAFMFIVKWTDICLLHLSHFNGQNTFLSKGISFSDIESNFSESNLPQMQRKNISQESLLNSSGKKRYFHKHFALTFLSASLHTDRSLRALSGIVLWNGYYKKNDPNLFFKPLFLVIHLTYFSNFLLS